MIEKEALMEIAGKELPRRLSIGALVGSADALPTGLFYCVTIPCTLIGNPSVLETCVKVPSRSIR
jgi:hypothetical protein